MSIRRWSLTVVICFAVFAALALFKVMEIRAAIAFGESFPEHSETVEEARVEETGFTPTIKVMGTVVAAKRLDLHNELAGEIVQVNFRSGDHVQAGQILLQLDVAIEQANLGAALARADLAKSTYERARELFGRNAVSKEQLDQAQSDLAASQAAVKVLQRTIDKKTLRAPFAATAGLHQFEVGQYLPENTLVTTLIGDSDEVWVDFKVPQFYRPLSTGSAVTVETIGQQAGSSAVTGTVIAENTVVQTANRSRLYRAAIQAGNKAFMANTMVSVQVPIGDAVPLLKVPAVSIQYDALGAYVFRLQKAEDGQGFRAHRHQVRVKTTIGDAALLEPASTADSLSVGARIAAAGAFKLYEGILVFVPEPQPAAATDAENMAAEGTTGAPQQEAL
ncbi:efflux RND transporter periplasmic adaptor subunit [Ketobacter sp.]|uniref:efflux RND transporter periplasmic adaptor subunit n=1 Tax=Ketobacter sp. TaxID=2083498 RepID=UPI000F23F77B|nr:efflux RND transporter periplasmic adaptor subunit [Ketobacter sp.]RLU00141.1 MAG: efflux RND transporter periplasmic adaptor subunit [Ketobacter sp.]